ncbi:MAG TPA: DCC1-like thiol-disulfide oxidoreductase family protein [Dermatophilaceae bacterium]|nr:DCC1-like thiol-disulfide oxidoreductase family protein [Dermatophilaceae bacterium]
MDAPRPVLVFDGDCGFCTASARWIVRYVNRPPRYAVAPWQHLDLDSLGLTAPQCDAAVQWVGRDGARASGHAAIAAALRHGHPVWRVPGLVITAPAVSWLAERVYTWVAGHRYLLPGGTPACRVG